VTKPTTLRFALILSLLVNLGVLGAIGYRAIAPGEGPHGPEAGGEFRGLARHLSLSDEQQRHWRETEKAFLAQLTAGAEEIRQHRDRMIREIFAGVPDVAKVETERAAIARLQDEQHRLVIEQLLREREMLDERQRGLLLELLLDQPAGASGVEQLHRD